MKFWNREKCLFCIPFHTSTKLFVIIDVIYVTMYLSTFVLFAVAGKDMGEPIRYIFNYFLPFFRNKDPPQYDLIKIFLVLSTLHFLIFFIKAVAGVKAVFSRYIGRSLNDYYAFSFTAYSYSAIIQVMVIIISFDIIHVIMYVFEVLLFPIWALSNVRHHLDFKQKQRG